MIRVVVASLLCSTALLLAGCGSAEETVSIGIDTNGESITMPRSEGLDYLFEHEKGVAALGREICQLIDRDGEDKAKRLFVKNFKAEMTAEFPAEEIFENAAGRC